VSHVLGRHGRDPLTPKTRGRSQQARPQGPSFQQTSNLDSIWTIAAPYHPKEGLAFQWVHPPAGGFAPRALQPAR